ncbi:Hypothetical predicted protein [Xyrichtys novacula]|uniref:Uncharacterized protein n=1 Tax=Xyrichtys novacula TaxID=13765 RepID=A0AAV1EQ68_XYRNO|nr:Hypothetical predicted protein [Xyrichtys novacula]
MQIKRILKEEIKPAPPLHGEGNCARTNPWWIRDETMLVEGEKSTTIGTTLLRFRLQTAAALQPRTVLFTLQQSQLAAAAERTAHPNPRWGNPDHKPDPS